MVIGALAVGWLVLLREIDVGLWVFVDTSNQTGRNRHEPAIFERGFAGLARNSCNRDGRSLALPDGCSLRSLR
jgi:hypothetical protein